MINNSMRKHRSRLALLSIVLGLILAAMPAMAQTANPGTFPPGSTPYNLTYGEWNAKWWQWVVSIPVDSNPLFDKSTCDQHQSGNVWFLVGTTGGAATRSCAIPAGKALLIPVVNTICVATLPEETAEQQQDCAKAAIDSAVKLQLEVDGAPIKRVRGYRAPSPIFDITLPEKNVFELPPGVYGPAAADGYYVMLKPLARGQHTIRFSGEIQAFNFATDVTYNLTVQ